MTNALVMFCTLVSYSESLSLLRRRRSFEENGDTEEKAVEQPETVNIVYKKPQGKSLQKVERGHGLVTE